MRVEVEWGGWKFRLFTRCRYGDNQHLSQPLFEPHSMPSLGISTYHKLLQYFIQGGLHFLTSIVVATTTATATVSTS